MQSNSHKGLNNKEVLESRTQHGANVLKEYGRNNWTVFFEVLKEPMMLILTIACSIYFITGEVQEGVIMLIAIGFVAGISIFQQIRSEHAVKALKKLSQALTIVIRNDEKISVPTEDIVVGDLLIVSEGQPVPADATIIESNDMEVDESILTGESFPVVKNFENNLLFSGTTVTAGLAHAQVTEVGNQTRLGKLGKAMQEIVKEKTPLQKQIDVFVKRMALFGFIAFVFVWIYNYFASGDLLHGLMHGLTLAMAAMPEEIPLALSTFMALGAYHLIKAHVLAKQPQTVEALGAATVICVDKTGTITENKMEVAEVYVQKSQKTFSRKDGFKEPDTQHLLLIAMLASEPVPFDPMEKAIHDVHHFANNETKTFKLIKEYPLGGNPPFMTHIYQDETGNRIITCKGAPEGIMRNANLTSDEITHIQTLLKSMAAKGNRLLAVATSDYDEAEFPETQSTFKWNFLGLIALSDPPKKNINTVIQSFYDAGIVVKMITGDYPETACSIARQVGIKHPEHFITGVEIEKLSDAELNNKVTDIHIFARTLPETKLRIIQALKANGDVVAMTGDGVNDGPALKAAHIGIAMGNRGSEVARQAASLILVNDDLSSMVNAVALGRKIYSNLKKAIQYIISIHIPLISIVTLPLVLGWKYPNIFNPVHVIFLELVMGPTCSIVFENEPMEKKLMNQKPRKVSSEFFTWKEFSMSALQGLVITCGLLFILYFSIHTMMDENTARTMVFTTLIFSNVLLTLTGRSKKYSMLTTIRYKNFMVPVITGITLLILALALYVHPVQHVFSFNHISISNILICAATAFVSVLWIELYKIIAVES